MLDSAWYSAQDLYKTISLLGEFAFPIRIVIYKDVCVVLQPQHFLQHSVITGPIVQAV